jgi:hypothetical protein
MLDIKPDDPRSDDDMHSSIDRASTPRRYDVECGSSSSVPGRAQSHQMVPSSIRNSPGALRVLDLDPVLGPARAVSKVAAL